MSDIPVKMWIYRVTRTIWDSANKILITTKHSSTAIATIYELTPFPEIGTCCVLRVPPRKNDPSLSYPEQESRLKKDLHASLKLEEKGRLTLSFSVFHWLRNRTQKNIRLQLTLLPTEASNNIPRSNLKLKFEKKLIYLYLQYFLFHFTKYILYNDLHKSFSVFIYPLSKSRSPLR